MHAFTKTRTETLTTHIYATMDPIDSALAACEAQDTPNYNAIAKEYEINRITLSRRHRGKTTSKADARNLTSFLSNPQEIELIRYINRLTANGLLPTNVMITKFAANIARKQPGKNWISRFIARHKNILKSAYLKDLDLSRKRADNEYLMRYYFDFVNKVL